MWGDAREAGLWISAETDINLPCSLSSAHTLPSGRNGPGRPRSILVVDRHHHRGGRMEDKAIELGETAATEPMDVLSAADVHLWGRSPQNPTAALKGLSFVALAIRNNTDA